MAVIAESEGTVLEGPNYRWVLEETDNDGCRLSVWIDTWGLSRVFPAVLSSEEADTTAAQMAPGLLTIINS